MTVFTKAHQRYKTKSGIIVPGVTTILNLLNKPALVYWAWNLGMHGEDYRKVSGKAASIGTIAHYMVECYLKGEQPELDEYSAADIRQAQLASHDFQEWWESQELELVESEAQLVSDEWTYGGTIDIVAKKTATGEIWLIDIKTSKGIYDEMKYQLAAYWHMWDENRPDQRIDKAHIIRMDKETGAIGFYAMGNLDIEWKIFQCIREVYHLQKKNDVKRRGDTKYRRPARAN